MPDILTLTMNPAVDVTFRIDHVSPGRKLRCARPRYEPGGGGVNVSRTIRELGGSSMAVWTCGGMTGDLYRDLLDEAGLDHEPIAVDAWTRQNVIVTEESTNEQYRFCLPGPELTGDEVDRCLERLSQVKRPRFAVFSGSLPPGAPSDFYARAARALGPDSRVLVDAADEALAEAVRGGVYAIKPNVRELGQVVGRDLDDDDVVESGRRLVAESELEVVLISFGSDGAVLVTRAGTHELPAPDVSPRSRVGAGDSMVGAFVCRLNAGDEPLSAARYGVAAGAATAITPGTELCRRRDVERLARRVE